MVRGSNWTWVGVHVQEAVVLSTTLLLDADIFAYQASASKQRDYDWGDGVTSQVADLDEMKAAVEDEIEHLVKTLKADEVIVCLSDEVDNFRLEVDPTYKSNRAGTERPVQLYELKEWLAEEWPCRQIPRLEADDVMGILATEPHEGKRIIVSDDKDMQTVPCFFYRPCRNRDGKKEGVREITPEFAERFMLWQALTGDTTDGYPGCPGIGPVAADLILDKFVVRESYPHELKSGPRKGQTELRRHNVTYGSRWEAIVAAYKDAGLKEADAIRQVNLARILKHSDYVDGRIVPWTP